MRKLFWTFFSVFWLALLISGFTVGTAVWLHHQSLQSDVKKTDEQINVHAEAYVVVAADIYRHGGMNSLIEFLEQNQNGPFPKVYAINETGQDLLKRPIHSALIAYVKQLNQQGEFANTIQYASDSSSQRILLFPPKLTSASASSLNLSDTNDTANILTESFSQQRPDNEDDPPLSNPILLLIGSGLFGALFFSTFLAWYFIKPIAILRKAFAQIASGQLDTRIGNKMGHRQDELVELGENFDEMASKISQLMTAQQRLLHDVSHELRSPLARMQAAVGIAEQQPDKAQNTLARIDKESQRMNDLIGELLVLSRLETEVVPNQQSLSVLSLNDLLDEIISDARFEAATKDVVIDYQITDDIHLPMHSELLHRAIENILRNAIKFSAQESHVSLSVIKNTLEKTVIIKIEDNGPGVAEDELEAIFEPFFRGQLIHRNDSIGLGLAIAFRAVHAHHGKLKAYNRDQGGLCLEMLLPIK